MADRDGEMDADVIVAGRGPPGHLPRPGGAVWVLVLTLTAALAVAVAIAVHYRAEVGMLRHGRTVTSRPTGSPLLPEMTSVSLQLPADGTVAGMVVITAATQPGEGRAQFTVSAVITGGTPGTVYDLTGNDCSTEAPLPDHVWASGLAGANGTADLVGHAWTGAVADRYWLAVNPSAVNPPPGLRGQFAEGRAARFPAGQAPCAPLPVPGENVQAGRAGLDVVDQARSNRSRFITLTHAATKSFTNFSFASSLA